MHPAVHLADTPAVSSGWGFSDCLCAPDAADHLQSRPNAGQRDAQQHEQRRACNWQLASRVRQGLGCQCPLHAIVTRRMHAAHMRHSRSVRHRRVHHAMPRLPICHLAHATPAARVASGGGRRSFPPAGASLLTTCSSAPCWAKAAMAGCTEPCGTASWSPSRCHPAHCCHCDMQLRLQPSSPCTMHRLTAATRRPHLTRGNTNAHGLQVIETPCDKGDNDEPVPLFEADKGAGLSHPNIVQTYKSSSTISKVLSGFRGCQIWPVTAGALLQSSMPHSRVSA